MSLDPVSMDTTESQDIFEVTEQQVLWNYHGVKELDKKSDPAILHALSAKHETRNSLSHRKETIKPMMSGGGKVTAGVDKDGNWNVGGEITFEWGGSSSDNDGNNSSNENTTSDSPPDTPDQNTDNN